MNTQPTSSKKINKTCGILLMVLSIFLILMGLLLTIVNPIIGIIGIILGIIAFIYGKKCIIIPQNLSKPYDNRNKTQLKTTTFSETTKSEINSLPKKTPREQLYELIIESPDINLKKGEVCFYQGPAQSCKKKTVVTGYSGGGAGVNLRVAKGISIHSGNNSKKAIRETITEKYPGTFYITNYRLILLAEKYGFNASIPTIIQLKQHSDGFILYQTSKTNIFLTKDVKIISEILNLISTAYKQQ